MKVVNLSYLFPALADFNVSFEFSDIYRINDSLFVKSETSF